MEVVQRHLLCLILQTLSGQLLNGSGSSVIFNHKKKIVIVTKWLLYQFFKFLICTDQSVVNAYYGKSELYYIKCKQLT